MSWEAEVNFRCLLLVEILNEKSRELLENNLTNKAKTEGEISNAQCLKIYLCYNQQPRA
jgi:hypothetical protein